MNECQLISIYLFVYVATFTVYIRKMRETRIKKRLQ